MQDSETTAVSVAAALKASKVVLVGVTVMHFGVVAGVWGADKLCRERPLPTSDQQTMHTHTW